MAGTMAMATPFAGRNRLINGAFDVAQRGTSFTDQNGYALDRWFCNRSGGAAGVTFAQVYGAFSTTKNWMSVQRTNGNTSTASAAMYQAIEGANCRDLAGQTVAVSFTVGTGAVSSTTNNVTAQLFYQATTTDIGPTGSWTSISSTSFSIAASTSPARYSTTFAVPSNATQLELVISVAFSGTASTDDRYYFTEIQLEPGFVTPFERRLIGLELALCQRYYYRSDNTGNNGILLMGGVEGTTAAAVGSVLPVTMRATPTLAFGADVRLYTAATAVITTTINTQRCSKTNAGALINGTGMTVGQAAYVYNSGGTNSYFDCSAELT